MVGPLFSHSFFCRIIMRFSFNLNMYSPGYKKVERSEINFSSKVKVIFTFWCLLMHLEWLQYGNMGYKVFQGRDTKLGILSVDKWLIKGCRFIQILIKWVSMTSLFAHKVAQPTKWRFLPKNLSQLVIFVIGLAFTWSWDNKNRAQF